MNTFPNTDLLQYNCLHLKYLILFPPIYKRTRLTYPTVNHSIGLNVKIMLLYFSIMM